MSYKVHYCCWNGPTEQPVLHPLSSHPKPDKAIVHVDWVCHMFPEETLEQLLFISQPWAHISTHPPIPVIESFRGKWYTYTLTHKNTVLKTKFRSFSVFQNDSNLYLCVTVPSTRVPPSQGNLPRSPGRADALCYGLCPGTALGCPPPSIHTSAPCVDCRRELPKERISFTLHSRCPAGVWHIIHTRWTS